MNNFVLIGQSSGSFSIFFLFHGKVSLDSVLLLLVLSFMGEFRLELMYIFLIKSIRSSRTHLHGFQLLVLPI